MGKLTATTVKAANAPGRYADGGGLYVLVGKTGSKSSVARVQMDGRRRDTGLGSAAKVSLKLVRDPTAIANSQVEARIAYVAERREATGIPSFREPAALDHAEHDSGWKGGNDSTHGK